MAKVKLELTIPSGLKDEPIIYAISKNFNLIPNIIEASFSTSMGWVVLTIDGEGAEIEKLLVFLKEKNITAKNL